jgi:hypothetical protein
MGTLGGRCDRLALAGLHGGTARAQIRSIRCWLGRGTSATARHRRTGHRGAREQHRRDGFHLGDNSYPNGTDSDFANCYDPSWPVQGTHAACGGTTIQHPGGGGLFILLRGGRGLT